MSTSTQAKHKMGVAEATIVGMNAMIGAGIFILPEPLHRAVGPAALLSYLFVIGAIWCMAYSLSRVAAYYPQEGSFYTYISSWAGKQVGLIMSLVYCAGIIVATGLLTRMTGIYLNKIFPQFSPTALGSFVLFALAASIAAGTRLLRWGQIILIVLTIAPLLIITFLCLLKANIANLSPFMPYGFGAVLRATKIVIFGFFGFEAVTTLYGNVKNPEYTMPRAITWAIILVSFLYVLFIASTFLGLPRELFAEGKNLQDALYASFPSHPIIISMVIWGIIVTIMGTIHALLWSISSLLLSIAKLSNSRLLTSQTSLWLVTFLVWAVSVTFKSMDLFFNVTALFIIAALSASIWPLASGRIPATRNERMIAVLGLITAAIMCWYALAGIVKVLTA
jgi:amino acid efflux transporter